MSRVRIPLSLGLMMEFFPDMFRRKKLHESRLFSPDRDGMSQTPVALITQRLRSS
jgi:hypothetical protein